MNRAIENRSAIEPALRGAFAGTTAANGTVLKVTAAVRFTA